MSAADSLVSWNFCTCWHSAAYAFLPSHCLQKSSKSVHIPSCGWMFVPFVAVCSSSLPASASISDQDQWPIQSKWGCRSRCYTSDSIIPRHDISNHKFIYFYYILEGSWLSMVKCNRCAHAGQKKRMTLIPGSIRERNWVWSSRNY